MVAKRLEELGYVLEATAEVFFFSEGTFRLVILIGNQKDVFVGGGSPQRKTHPTEANRLCGAVFLFQGTPFWLVFEGNLFFMAGSPLVASGPRCWLKVGRAARRPLGEGETDVRT